MDDTPEAREEQQEANGFDFVQTLFKGGSVVFIGVIFEIGVSFIGKLLIARELGRFSYGAVSLGIITAAIGSTLVLLGLDRGIGRYLPRKRGREQQRGVLISAFRIAAPFAILTAICLFMIAPILAVDVFNDPALSPILRIFAIAIPIGAVMKLALGTVRGMQHTLPKVLIENTTIPLTRLTGIVVALLIGAGAIGISYAYVASYAVAMLVGLYYLYTRTPLFSSEIPYNGQSQELLRFSLPLVVTSAMTIVLSDIDMYMLGAFQGTGPVGVYNVVYPIAQLLTVVISSFGFLFMPVISELDANSQHRQMKRLYKIVTKWIVVATLPLFLGLITFPQLTIRYTFGSEYVTGATALAVLAVGFFVHTVFGLNKGALTSLGYTRTIMIDDTIAAAFNIILNLALIPEYGLLGAAIATTATYMLLNGLYSAQLYRKTEIQPFTRNLVIPLVIGTIALGTIYTLAQGLLPASPLVPVTSFTLFLMMYALGILRFGIEPEEVRLVLSFEERFGVDLGPVKRVVKRFL